MHHKAEHQRQRGRQQGRCTAKSHANAVGFFNPWGRSR